MSMNVGRHRPRKRFGQNFLTDQLILERIVRAINPKQEDHLIEIGPGQGALTKQLQDKVLRLDAIEIDRDLVALLNTHLHHPKLFIHQGDALTFDFATLFSPKKKARIVGNLPYNISTPLLFTLFKHLNNIEDMHFLLQKEVVDRIIAPPNNKTYGRLSVMTQYFCKVEKLLHIPKDAFNPPPKVESSVIRLIPHHPLPYTAANFTQFSLIVREAFNHRRKTIQNALSAIIDRGTLEQANIDPKKRPEQLSIEDYVRISNEFQLP